MPNGTYGGVRGRKTKEVGGNFENPLFSSYSICNVRIVPFHTAAPANCLLFNALCKLLASYFVQVKVVND